MINLKEYKKFNYNDEITFFWEEGKTHTDLDSAIEISVALFYIRKFLLTAVYKMERIFGIYYRKAF